MKALEDALAAAETPDDVLDVIVEHVDRLTGAERIAVALLEVNGEWAHAVRTTGYLPEVLVRLRRFRIDADLPLAESMRSGTAVVVPDVDLDWSGSHDVRWATRQSGHRALASVPFTVGGRVLGGIGLSFRDPQPFDADQMRELLTVADLCAAGLERVYPAVVPASGPVEGSLEAVAAAALVLYGQLDVEEALRRLASCAAEILGAPAAAATLTLDQPSLSPITATYAVRGEEATAEKLLRHVLDEEVTELTTTAEGELLAPLVAAGGQMLGALAVARPEPWAYSEDDATVLLHLAGIGCAAVELAHLREIGERSSDRMAFLSAATRELARTLDARRVIESLARLAVPRLGDCVSVFVVEDGELVARSVAHRDPLDTAWVAAHRDQRLPIESDRPEARAFRLGDLVVFDNARGGSDVVAGMAVPVMVDELPVAVVSLGIVDGERAFDPDDLAVARELAARASVAFRNADRYETQHGIAEVLQRAVLPERLPTIESLELAAVYAPASDAARLGGDWYDAFPLADGRIGLCVGDVVGHGVRAAATMGQLRNALRAYAISGDDPAEVLERLHDFALVTASTDFATVVYAIVDPVTCRLTWADAGHPPIVRRSGRGDAATVEVLPERHGSPIGVSVPGRPRTQSVDLELGDALILYTDGLVERRGELFDVGLERVIDTVGSSLDQPGTTLASLCDELLQLAPNRADDVCVLAVRLVRPGA